MSEYDRQKDIAAEGQRAALYHGSKTRNEYDIYDMQGTINMLGKTIDAVRAVRDVYASQARFADVDAASYFREFIRRIDAALALARGGK